jgi:hypothetical protein
LEKLRIEEEAKKFINDSAIVTDANKRLILKDFIEQTCGESKGILLHRASENGWNNYELLPRI